MENCSTDSGNEKISPGEYKLPDHTAIFSQLRGLRAFYVLALIVSIGTWFIAIRAPLRVDETGSYWQIAAGISGIWPRQFTSPPAYFYILWLSTKLLGASEIALRLPSVFAMLGAVYLLYLSARQLVDREFAAIATIVFSLNYTVVFVAIDIRPYAFATLLTNAAILVLLHLRRNDSNWLAALFGLLSAGILSFHYLFAAVLPAFLVCFIAFKLHNKGILWRQCCVSLAVFTVACIPLLPGLHYMFRTANTHVVSPHVSFSTLLLAFIPGWLLPSAALTALMFAARKHPAETCNFEKWKVLFVACLAVIPVVILYIFSVATSLEVFNVIYHRSSAIPGISFAWAMAVYRFRSRAIRLAFCILFVGLSVSFYLFSPQSKDHAYSWKYALQVVQDMSSKDDAPVVICSNFTEGNSSTMPAESPKESVLFAPLSYYKITSPIVPLPEGLNSETKRIFLPFLREAVQKHQRFLAVGHEFSFAELDWISQAAAAEYSVRTVGIYDQVKVLEFVPRHGPA